MISLKEMQKAMMAINFNATKEQVKAVFVSLDTDGGGKIEYSELFKKIQLQRKTNASTPAKSTKVPGGSKSPGSAKSPGGPSGQWGPTRLSTL